MPAETTLAERATALLELHRPGDPVILPTVWDAWSARLATDAGFAALTGQRDPCPLGPT
jgi:2-methylisocitrate lyase-like PEP mutase family enzyme